jgi:hypothetical protein
MIIPARMWLLYRTLVGRVRWVSHKGVPRRNSGAPARNSEIPLRQSLRSSPEFSRNSLLSDLLGFKRKAVSRQWHQMAKKMVPLLDNQDEEDHARIIHDNTHILFATGASSRRAGKYKYDRDELKSDNESNATQTAQDNPKDGRKASNPQVVTARHYASKATVEACGSSTRNQTVCCSRPSQVQTQAYLDGAQQTIALQLLS